MNGDNNTNLNIYNMKQIVKIVNTSKNPLPSYATPFSSGIDLMAMVEGYDRVMIYPNSRALIHTGLYMAIPDGFELQIRPRSGLALKKGITVLNSPGTIDSDYRGEVGIIIINHSNEAISFGNGDKIAQGVLARVNEIEWELVNDITALPVSIRGEGGFGSSGINTTAPIE